MSSESETPDSAPKAEAPKPAFKIASNPGDSAPKPKPTGMTRAPIPPRPSALAGTAAPAKVSVPVVEKKGESPLFIILDLFAAAAAITFAVILYQIHAGPTAL